MKQLVCAGICVFLWLGGLLAKPTPPPQKKAVKKTSASSRSKTAPKRPAVAAKAAPAKSGARTGRAYVASRQKTVAGRSRLRRVIYSPWKEPTYADSTSGDRVEGEDLEVRRAAVEALGPLNGSVTVVDAQTGRLLSVVNQRVAFAGGYTPCSTIKVFVGMAGLSEGIIERDTPVVLSRRVSHTLTSALAKSDNPYFARLGEKLGFERVIYYSKLFGLGEQATLGFDGETPGTLPGEPPADGVGMMSSFGHGIRLTPLQLASGLAALANGGTLYYLQYPQSRVEVENYVPRVKRHLDIRQWLPEIKPGMLAAVDHGTARRAGMDADEPLMGKTGTCTDTASPTHLGWFGSFNDTPKNRLAVVVLLTGGRPINGPVASGVAGQVFRRLRERGYFERERPASPATLVSSAVSSN